MKIALCLLTLNEADGVRADVPRLPTDAFDEVFAMDGGSTDGTVEWLRGHGIDVRMQHVKGYNGALISAFETSDADAIVFFHPKGTVGPEVLPRLKAEVLVGHGLVVASRIGKGARNEEDSQLIKPRKWFVMGLALLTRLMFQREGRPVWDVLHGMRALTRDAYTHTDLLRRGLTGDLEMVVAAYRLRIARSEVPVQERPRIAGETHFKAIPTGWRLLKYLWWEATARKRPKPGEPARMPQPTAEDVGALGVKNK